jgi:DNA-binding CsgD family transcriptional regulator
MPRQLPSLHLSVSDREQIERWLNAHGTPQQVALRSRIVLAASDGQSDSLIARTLETNRKTVTLWPGPLRGAGSRESVGSGPGARP